MRGGKGGRDQAHAMGRRVWGSSRDPKPVVLTQKALDEEQRREEEARSKLPKEQKELSEAEALVHELCPNCSEVSGA